jgi:hypothetical protein
MGPLSSTSAPQGARGGLTTDPLRTRVVNKEDNEGGAFALSSFADRHEPRADVDSEVAVADLLKTRNEKMRNEKMIATRR